MTEIMQPPTELAAEVPAVLAWARGLAIATPDAFAEAGEGLKRIKGAARRVLEFFRPMKQRADEAKRAILDAEKKLAFPLDEAEDLAKRKMLIYQRAEEEKCQIETRRLQAEADDKARREREALQAKAAQMKTAAKQQEYAERAASVMAPVVQVAAQVPKVSGVSTKKLWQARVVDAGKVPRDFLLVDERKLDQYAKAMREMAKVEGVEFYQEDVLASRAS